MKPKDKVLEEKIMKEFIRRLKIKLHPHYTGHTVETLAEGSITEDIKILWDVIEKFVREECEKSIYKQYQKNRKHDLLIISKCREKITKLEEERNRIKKEIENSPRIITEHELQNMKTIELSYDGRLIPVEEVLKIIKEMEK